MAPQKKGYFRVGGKSDLGAQPKGEGKGGAMLVYPFPFWALLLKQLKVGLQHCYRRLQQRQPCVIWGGFCLQAKQLRSIRLASPLSLSFKISIYQKRERGVII